MDTKNETNEVKKVRKSSRGRKKRRLIIGIIVILFLALVGYRIVDNYILNEDEEETAAVNVKVSTAEMGDICVESPVTAKIEAGEEVAVVPVVAGKVTAVYYDEGDYVKKGAVLFKIDSTQAEASVVQASSAVSQAKAGADQLLESMNLAKDSMDLAKSTLERTEYLYNEGAVSLQEYESVKTQYASAQTQYSNLQIQYKSAQEQQKTALSAYNTAKEALSYYSVTAPISGCLTSFSVTAGGVAGQTAMGYISDTSDLEINCSLSESLAGKVNEGDDVDVYISTLDRTIVGNVKTFTKIPQVGKVTYPMTISIENPDNDILAGMFAEVKIKSEQSNQAVIVPSEAVVIKNGQSSVVTILGDMPIINPVETGIDNGTEVEIISGIEAGDVIVVSGQQYVKEGEKVNIVE